MSVISGFFFFFFQAEDGIRDLTVTGVQTCALPICERDRALSQRVRAHPAAGGSLARAVPGQRGDLRGGQFHRRHRGGDTDRKSTRLNSSHSQISYAVFCLKKKKKKNKNLTTTLNTK